MAAKAPKNDFVTVKLRRVEAEALKQVVGGTPAQAIRKLLTKAQEEENARDIADAKAALEDKGRSYSLDELESLYALPGGAKISRQKRVGQTAPKRASKNS